MKDADLQINLVDENRGSQLAATSREIPSWHLLVIRYLDHWRCTLWPHWYESVGRSVLEGCIRCEKGARGPAALRDLLPARARFQN